MEHILSKSKYIRGLQCVKALYFDVRCPDLARYSYETLAKFRQGRNFERLFKSTFPQGIDISARLRGRISQYAPMTSQLLQASGETTLFEAGFIYDGTLVLADVVHKQADGSLTIYEVKNSSRPSDTFFSDIALQHYVISHAIESIHPCDLFCSELTIKHFYLLYHDADGTFQQEDRLRQSLEQHPFIASNIARFKEILQQPIPPPIAPSPHCDTPYECPYKHLCAQRPQ